MLTNNGLGRGGSLTLRYLIGVVLLVTTIPLALGQLDVIWEKTYGGSKGDSAFWVAETSDGGFIVAGGTESFGPSTDVYLLRVDSLGNVVWEKTYGDYMFDELAIWTSEMTDGGFIVGGTASFGQSQVVYLFKVDALGDPVWEKTTVLNQSTRETRFLETSDGGFMVGGTVGSFHETIDAYWLKLDALGNKVWERRYEANGWDETFGIIETGDGGYVLAGWRWIGLEPFEEGLLFLSRIDASGNMTWEKTYEQARYDESYWIIQTRDGGFAIAGDHIYLMRTDAFGNVTWEGFYGGAESSEEVYCLPETDDGGLIVGGRGTSPESSPEVRLYDVYLLRTDAFGSPIWERTYGGVRSGSLRPMTADSWPWESPNSCCHPWTSTC